MSSLIHLSFSLLLALPLGAQNGPAGHWEGALKSGGREILLSLDLAQNAAGEWSASMGVPAQQSTGLYIKDLAVSGKTVTFVSVELQMAEFSLTLTPEGKLAGKMTMRMMPMPVEFERKGEAKVETIPPSPAVGKELEGDWVGSLATPEGLMRVAVHFRNRPGGTVAATIDSLNLGARDLPLNDVRQAGRKLEFGAKIARSRFEGSLNEDATELSGNWIRPSGSAPLTLRKLK